MKPAPFQYHDPVSVAEVLQILGAVENAKLLAGGQSLMPMMNMRYAQPDHIIDLNRVDGLSYIRETGDVIEIGAMTRQRDIEFSALVASRCPILQEAILNVGHRQTRNRGTVGGSLCHLDPAAELATIAALYAATLIVEGPGGRREIAFGDFALGFMTTALAPDELVVSVRFSVWPQAHGYAFLEFARRHGDFAVASAAALLAVNEAGRITRAAVAVGGVATIPLRITAIEQALLDQKPSEAVFRDACQACDTIDAMDDVHAPASYRQHLAGVLSRRALMQAAARAPS